jgi:hypothetical protein
MKTLFKSESKVSKATLSQLPKEFKSRTEKDFIINFFRDLPIESLKKLINFEEIDFENKELFNNIHQDEFYELIEQLRHENVIKYTCKLYLDVD